MRKKILACSSASRTPSRSVARPSSTPPEQRGSMLISATAASGSSTGELVNRCFRRSIIFVFFFVDLRFTDDVPWTEAMTAQRRVTKRKSIKKYILKGLQFSKAYNFQSYIFKGVQFSKAYNFQRLTIFNGLQFSKAYNFQRLTIFNLGLPFSKAYNNYFQRLTIFRGLQKRIGLVAKTQVSYSVFFASTPQILFKFYTLVYIAEKRTNICKLF